MNSANPQRHKISVTKAICLRLSDQSSMMELLICLIIISKLI